MTARVDLVLYAGQGLDASTCQWVWGERATPAGPTVPYDLTGYAARAMIRPTLTHTDTPLADWTTTNGKIVLGGAAGTITLVVSDTETTNLWSSSLPAWGEVQGRAAFLLGYWDLELVPPSTAVRRLMQGPAIIVPQVTRS